MAFGIWLVVGVCRFGAWLISLPLLAVFALHSLGLTLGNSSSCGCFGSVTVPPEVTLIFDICLLALLTRCRPSWHGWPILDPVGRTTLQATTIGVVILTALYGYVVLQYGSISIALAAMNGIPLVVSPGTVNAGLMSAGGQVDRNLDVTNLTTEPVDVAYAYSNCNCVIVSGLPVTIEPGKTVALRLTILAPQLPGAFQRKGSLRTTLGDVDFKLMGTVSIGSDSKPSLSGASRENR